LPRKGGLTIHSNEAQRQYQENLDVEGLLSGLSAWMKAALLVLGGLCWIWIVMNGWIIF